AELAQILAHETAHLSRRDDVALLIQCVIEAMLPWHPAVRFLTRQIDFEREVACDDAAIETQGARPYAACLTHLAELALPAHTLTASSISSHLVRRIDLLLDRTRHTGTRVLKSRLIVISALLVTACWAAA